MTETTRGVEYRLTHCRRIALARTASGQHLVDSQDSNLYVFMGEGIGAPVERCADSTGAL